jgi:uracil-DNA glycosylase
MVPNVEVDPAKIRVFMIAEAPPANFHDYFYATGKPFYLETTLNAFTAAGCPVRSMQDIINRGVYVTTAVKCGKRGYSVSLSTVNTCAELLLEKELTLFPSLRAYLLMGDLAIRAFNHASTRATGKRVIPSGSTYKIRRGTYSYNERRVYPSYLMTGKSYLIEKSKQKMIAEDIRSALALV